MEQFSLKSRAIVFAMCAGAVAFILALAAMSRAALTAEEAGIALVAAIVCGVMCWATAERLVAATAGAIDSAIERLSSAAEGDLKGEIPQEVEACVPPLAHAMRSLFDQLHANIANVEHLALFDAVTRLPNRTHFARSCDVAIAALPPGASATLFFIDLDRFKAVNDTLGHANGDVLLGIVAERLRAAAERLAGAGASPIVGRLAGDEFTIFFPELGGQAAAGNAGAAILATLSEPVAIAEQRVQIGASLGFAQFPKDGTNLTALMRAADAAMYHAKRQGRGRIEPFSKRLADAIAQRGQLERDLREAIARDEFSLVYQPQLRAADDRIVGAEALLRWRRPDGEMLPGAFIACAEETGLIVDIGERVIARVAEAIARWERLGIQQRLAVNISQRELDHASFFRRLREAMHDARAPAAKFELEITETLAMECSDEVLEAIAALRADGASVAIDDFGTGYSNLVRLRHLPVDRVKLDRSLTEHVADHAGARAIAQAVISLIHGMGCEAIAEGIESEAQGNVLRVLGCDVLQGYAIAAPMAEQEFVSLVQQPRRAVG